MRRSARWVTTGWAFLALAAAGACAAQGDQPIGPIHRGTAGAKSSGAAGSGAAGIVIGDDGGPDHDAKTCADAAAAKSYIGCDYWPTVTANNVWSDFDFAAVVANAGDAPAEVTVTRNGATVGTATVQPGSLEKIYLPWVADLKGLDSSSCADALRLTKSVLSKGGAYHLVSSVPVTVYQFNALEYAGTGGPPGKDWSKCPGNTACDEPGNPNDGAKFGCFSFTNDASLLLPSTAMTGNYRIVGHQGWADAYMGSYAAITATQDNTHVVLQLGAKAHMLAGGGLLAAGPGEVVDFDLQAGDVAEIATDFSGDLSGSLLQATGPVQVITGMPCLDIPHNAAACDHVEESNFPAETLGKHYFVPVPTSPGGAVVGHQVRLFGNVDGTTLTYNGTTPFNAPSTIGAGEVVDLAIVNAGFEILGDHEFAVASFSEGGSVVDPKPASSLVPSRGDPDESFPTAVEQYRSTYIFLSPNDYDESWVDVTMPMDAKVSVDGVALTLAPTEIASGYGVARIPLMGSQSGGAHSLVATVPVGVQVMGFGSYTSYQYPAGLNLLSIAPPPPSVK